GICLGNRKLSLRADGHPDGPATLFFRPQDVEIASTEDGAIAGRVLNVRRHGATRRLEIELDFARWTIEIDLPASAELPAEGRISVRPTRFRLFGRQAG